MAARILPMILITGVNKLRGFTLVEIMVSVVILGVGLTSVANSYMLALRAANTAQNSIGALILAKEKFEALEFNSLKGIAVAQSKTDEIKTLSRNYQYQEEIKAITESEDFVLASLTVSWSEKNSLKNVSLATYLPKQK